MQQPELLELGTRVSHPSFGNGQIISYGENQHPRELEGGFKYGYYIVYFESEPELKTFSISAVGEWLTVIK